MHFIQMNLFMLTEIYRSVQKGRFDRKSILAWLWPGDKPLLKPVMGQFTAIYVRNQPH